MNEAGLIPITGAVPTAMFNPTTFTLANGMQVVVVTNRRAPVVAHYVWYRVGCADSPPGKSGLPHFLEHLMFKGTRRISPGEFSKIVARNGGNDNAFTSYDFTAYFQMIAKDRLELVMELEADRMVNLDLSDEHVYPERDVILEERKQRVDNEPQALLAEAVQAAQFLHHPYRLPIIGWLHEIAGYTREDAIAFYERWYGPNNAILICVGDIDAEELAPLAERHYGNIPARPVPRRERVQEPPQHAARRVELVRRSASRRSSAPTWPPTSGPARTVRRPPSKSCSSFWARGRRAGSIARSSSSRGSPLLPVPPTSPGASIPRPPGSSRARDQVSHSSGWSPRSTPRSRNCSTAGSKRTSSSAASGG